MSSFTKELSLRWSDLDPNFHVRHSVYYDFGAQHRIEILEQQGLSIRVLQENHIGPILFKEECVFRKELRLNQQIFITTKIAKLNADASRWTIVHELTNDKNELCAKISVDGAWMDTKLRKLANPTPEVVLDVMNSMPRTDDFVTD
jgi:acyl-CoA thioester hydrolase